MEKGQIMIRYVQVKDAKGNPIDARVLIGPDVESLDRMEKTFAAGQAKGYKISKAESESALKMPIVEATNGEP
jgi:hypothetical protein